MTADSLDPQASHLETERMMRYDADKRSALLGYLIWFFLGLFGIHRLYLGRIVSGVAMLVLHGISWLLTFILIGFVGFAILGIWWVIDAFLIPGMTRSYNDRLIARLTR